MTGSNKKPNCQDNLPPDEFKKILERIAFMEEFHSKKEQEEALRREEKLRLKELRAPARQDKLKEKEQEKKLLDVLKNDLNLRQNKKNLLGHVIGHNENVLSNYVKF
jgi:hypothetical protein